MDFTLSPEQQRIKETAARVAREVIAPRAAASDREGTYPEDYMMAFREAGLLGLALPREYGGGGAGTLGLALAVEEVAKYDSGAGLLLLLTRLITASITMAGSEEQKQRYVRGVATGTLRGCFALTEPEAGSDAASIATTATRDGGDYLITGTKIWAGGATVADYAVVVAKTAPERGAAGVGIFLVDLPNPGFFASCANCRRWACRTCRSEIVLEGCRGLASALLGEEKGMFGVVLRTLNVVRPLVAARSVEAGGGRDAVRAGFQRKAAHLRPAADRAPGDRLRPRRTGDGDRGGAAADPSRGLAGGPGPRGARDGPLPLDGEGEGERDGGARRRPLRAGPRWLRLPEGLRRRTLLPRRPPTDARRGHQRDPPPDHLPRPGRRPARLGLRCRGGGRLPGRS
ncbi:MAG: acyl-CoA dehydrogenase family protein [Thermomicrobiales bacterium]